MVRAVLLVPSRSLLLQMRPGGVAFGVCWPVLHAASLDLLLRPQEPRVACDGKAELGTC